MYCYAMDGRKPVATDDSERIQSTTILSQTPTPLLEALAADPHTRPCLIPRLLDILLAYAALIDYSTTTTQPSPLLPVLPTIGHLCAAAATVTTVAVDWPAMVWPALRAICLLRYEPAFFHPSKRGPSSTWLAASPGFRALFQLVQALLACATSTSTSTSTSSNADAAAIVRGYVQWLLTLPTVATHVEHSIALLPHLLDAWGSAAATTAVGHLVLPPSPSPAASSVVWLLSNAAAVLHAALLSPSSGAHARALLLEQGKLALATALLAEAPPGVVSEQGLITLLTQGATTTTVCVDAQITAAARLLFHEDLLRRLAATTLLRPHAEEEVAGPLKVIRHIGSKGSGDLHHPPFSSSYSKHLRTHKHTHRRWNDPRTAGPCRAPLPWT